MKERDLDVDHSTVFRWVQRYAPEIDKRVRQHLKMSGTSYRVDETYNKVRKIECFEVLLTSVSGDTEVAFLDLWRSLIKAPMV